MLSSTIISVTTEVVCGEPQRVITQYLTEFEEDRCGTLRVTFWETNIVANMMWNWLTVTSLSSTYKHNYGRETMRSGKTPQIFLILKENFKYRWFKIFSQHTEVNHLLYSLLLFLFIWKKQNIWWTDIHPPTTHNHNKDKQTGLQEKWPTIWQEVLHFTVVAFITIFCMELINQWACSSIGGNDSEVRRRSHDPFWDIVVDVQHSHLHSDQVPFWTWTQQNTGTHCYCVKKRIIKSNFKKIQPKSVLQWPTVSMLSSVGLIWQWGWNVTWVK